MQKYGEKRPLLKSVPSRVADCSVPTRYTFVLMSFFGFTMSYMLRVNLSMALVAMVNKTNSANEANSTAFCGLESDSNHSADLAQIGELNWNPKQQGIVLSAFFYGYLVTQVLGGLIAQRYGGKHLFGVGHFIAGFLTLMTPVVARNSFYLMVCLRASLGFVMGLSFPGVASLMGRWSLPFERSKFSTIIGSGCTMGMVVAMFMSGFLCTHGFDGGWPSVFYVFGITTCVWFVFWIFLVYNSPDEHPRISKEERFLIMDSLRMPSIKKENKSVPWLSVATSPGVWAININVFCNAWFYSTLMTLLPTYMKTIFGLNLAENGFYSSLPYIVTLFTGNLGGFLADYLQTKGFSTTSTRKLMAFLGQVPQSLFLVAVSFVGCDKYLVIILFTLSIGIGSLQDSGPNTNIFDLAPKYAGTVYGVINTFSGIASALAPTVAGIIMDVEVSIKQWGKVFFISSSVNTFGTIVYLMMARGYPEQWAEDGQKCLHIQSEEMEKDGKLNV